MQEGGAGAGGGSVRRTVQVEEAAGRRAVHTVQVHAAGRRATHTETQAQEVAGGKATRAHTQTHTPVDGLTPLPFTLPHRRFGWNPFRRAPAIVIRRTRPEPG